MLLSCTKCIIDNYYNMKTIYTYLCKHYDNLLGEFVGELFLSLVLSTRPHAKLVRIDPTEALKLGGVHSFFDHDNIPGRNLFGSMAKDEEYFASREVGI